MAISVFQNFEFLNPKIQNFRFFLEKCPQNPNFQNFQKTGIYVTELPILNHHAKFQPDIFNF